MNKQSQTMDRKEDARLVAQFVNERDEAALTRIVEKYERLVWSVCCRVLDQRCDAEDAFQTTFELLATRAHRIRKPSSLASWLYGVAFRTANTVRRQRLRAMEALDESSLTGSSESVLDQIAKKNEQELVCEELMLMTEKFKTPLILFYFSGKSAVQIAEETGLSVTAVESRLRRGRRALASRLVRQGFTSSALLTCGAMMSSVFVRETLVNQTVRNSMIACAEYGWGTFLSSQFDLMTKSGAKLMFVKSTVVAGLSLLVGVGFIFHGTPATKSTQAMVLTMPQDNAPAENVMCEIVVEDDENHFMTAVDAHHRWLYSWVRPVADPIHQWLGIVPEEEEEEVELPQTFTIEVQPTEGETEGMIYRVVQGYEVTPVVEGMKLDASANGFEFSEGDDHFEGEARVGVEWTDQVDSSFDTEWTEQAEPKIGVKWSGSAELDVEFEGQTDETIQIRLVPLDQSVEEIEEVEIDN